MKKLILNLLASLFVAGSAFAASEGIAWDKFPKERVNDLASLQNGAKLFVNYCLNCHEAAFARYNRMRDIGLAEEQIKANLVFTDAKVGDLMRSAIDAREAKDWFGATPPDLTVIARSRADPSKGTGADYLYTYLRSYYRDDTKATGWNNMVFPSIGMPHVLWELQGERKPVFEVVGDHGHETHVFKGWEQVKPGSLNATEFDDAVGNLVAYLTWMGEPVAQQRYRLGVWVLLFLGVLALFAWRLNAAYWKDVK